MEEEGEVPLTDLRPGVGDGADNRDCEGLSLAGAVPLVLAVVGGVDAVVASDFAFFEFSFSVSLVSYANRPTRRTKFCRN